MQGPSAYQVIQAQQIVITGPGTPGNGLFVYNGAEALGNLIAQVVAPGVTLDPVGNSVNAVLNVGHWSPAGALLQHMGVDLNGNVYVADNTGATRILIANGGNLVWAQMEPAILFMNAFGAVIQVVDPQRGGNFQYQDLNSATQGVLIGSQVGKNTTDPIGGVAQSAGINIIDPVFGDSLSVVGANINFSQVPFTVNAKDAANTGSTNQGPFRSIAAPEQTQAGHVVQRWYGKSPDGTRAAGTVISLTDPPTRATPELLELQGSESLLGIATPGTPVAGTVTAFADANGGMLKTLAGVAGDTNVYLHGIAEYPLSADVSINSASNIAIFSVPVGAARYYVEVWLITQNAVAADPADFQFQGPASSGLVASLVSYFNLPGALFSASNTYTASFTGQNVGGNQELLVRLNVVFTASGTLTFNGKEHVAGNTINVSTGSKLSIKRLP